MSCRPDHPRLNDVASLERAGLGAAAAGDRARYVAVRQAIRAAGHPEAADDLDRIVATPAPTPREK